MSKDTAQPTEEELVADMVKVMNEMTGNHMEKYSFTMEDIAFLLPTPPFALTDSTKGEYRKWITLISEQRAIVLAEGVSRVLATEKGDSVNSSAFRDTHNWVLSPQGRAFWAENGGAAEKTNIASQWIAILHILSGTKEKEKVEKEFSWEKFSATVNFDGLKASINDPSKIAGAFIWAFTTEGFDYWQGIGKNGHDDKSADILKVWAVMLESEKHAKK